MEMQINVNTKIIYMDSAVPVMRAIENVKRDIRKVCCDSDEKGCDIVLIMENMQAEQFEIKCDNNMLVIYASDTLGFVYGLSDLKLIPLVFAGWLRYLMAVDDNGNAFEPSSDPMLAELTPYLKDIKWNDEQAEKKILPILAKSEIFGVNLAEAGLLCRVVKYFKELIAGVGAVRTTLHKYVSNN